MAVAKLRIALFAAIFWFRKNTCFCCSIALTMNAESIFCLHFTLAPFYFVILCNLCNSVNCNPDALRLRTVRVHESVGWLHM